MSMLRFASSVILLIATLMIIFFNLDIADLLVAIRKLAFSTVLLAFVALVANTLAAGLRLQIISTNMGYSISYAQAMAAVSGGNLAGAAFFQVVGQLIGRGYVMGRSGVPLAAVAVTIMYERLVAALVSALLALGGAYYIFGKIYIDQKSGGGDFIKIALGLIAATATGALIGHGRASAQLIAPLLSQSFAKRFLHVLCLSLLVQLPMMAAYILLTLSLSPHTPLADAAAASAVVMFAASIPISLGGWGVREMSAVFALGTIGISSGDAFLAAVLVGGGSMLAMAVTGAAAATAWSAPKTASFPVPPRTHQATDFNKILSWLLPLTAATLVLFQLYIPIASGSQLNVNLADPFAILAGILFVINAMRSRKLPRWRFTTLNISIGAATGVLALSLLIGIANHGGTTWAVVNRFLGWFVLLSFALTGATFSILKHGRSLNLLLLTFAGATAAVSAIEIALTALYTLGVDTSLPVVVSAAQGFAQNRNFFAFQLLMGVCATMIAAPNQKVRITLYVLMFAALWLCGSRSGWIALAAILSIGLYLRAAGWKEVASSLALASIGILTLLGLSVAIHSFGDGNNATVAESLLRPLVPNVENTEERLMSMRGGLNLFFDHPLFGAGLGAFREQKIIGSFGQIVLIHSTPIWLLAETGLVGFLVFATPAVLLIYFELMRKPLDDAGRLIVLIMAAFAVMAMPADMLYQRTFWLLFGAAISIPFTAAKRRSHHRLTKSHDNGDTS